MPSEQVKQDAPLVVNQEKKKKLKPAIFFVVVVVTHGICKDLDVGGSWHKVSGGQYRC